jgi:hypothetical protein
MEDRFVESVSTASAVDKPLQSRGLTGYDNLKQRYVTTWVTNWGTGITTLEGTYDASKKVFIYTGEAPNFQTGRYTKCRSVERIMGPENWNLEWYETGPDGKEYMSMEIHYSRTGR